MRDEKEERKTNKAKQHSTPKAVTCTCKYMCLVYSTYMYMYLNDSVFNPLWAAVMELASLWVSAGVPTLHSDQGSRAVT